MPHEIIAQPEYANNGAGHRSATGTRPPMAWTRRRGPSLPRWLRVAVSALGWLVILGTFSAVAVMLSAPERWP